MSKTVVITGAGSGIGRAAALAFLDVGWNVVATLRDPSKAAAAGLPLDHANLTVEALDVTSDDAAQAFTKRLTGHFGQIDVLVNNAGWGPMGPLELVPMDEMARIFETNSIGPIRMAQAVIPLLRDRGGGRIINVSSMGGEFTTPFGGAYHASKYALESLSDALRVELQPFGIEVIVIQPGPVATDLAANAVEGLSARARGLYAGPLTALVETSRNQMARGSGVLKPEQVARVVVRAAQAAKPRTRYKVGMIAHAMPFLRRRMSDRLWDGMWRQMLRARPEQRPSHDVGASAAR